MVAALLKILQSGIQDLRLLSPKGQPKIDFFTKVFIKAGRFTTQWSRIDFDQSPDFGKAASVTLPRKGHLISRMYLVVNLPDIATPQLAGTTAAAAASATFLGPTFGWTNSLGHVLVSSAQIDIGGSRTEVLDSQLLEVLDEFHTPLEKVTSVNRLIQRYDNGFTKKTIGWNSPTQVAVPLPFWFSRGDAGAFLPIDAISTDAVRLTINFAALGDTFVSDYVTDLTIAVQPGKVYPPILGSPFYIADPAGPFTFNGEAASILPGISMPLTQSLGDTYLMVEYIYLDKPEANRFRLADILLPIPQHYRIEPYDTRGFAKVSVPLRIPNPTRDIFFYAQRYEAPSYNAPFLATRDLSGTDCPVAPWWPDASGLNAAYFTNDYVPGYSTRDSDPISDFALIYEGRLVRYGTEVSAMFRSILPSINQRKSPWLNRYYYNLPFGVLNGFVPPSQPSGEANLDKIRRIDLELTMASARGCVPGTSIERFWIYIWAETYNIFRIYGGRAALMFAY